MIVIYKLINFIIPIYNTKREYLSRAINSIIIQKNVNFNEIGIIIVDDNSTRIHYDERWFKRNFPKLDITYIYNSVNSGPGISRQKGIDISNSEYVAFLDSDDELYGNNCLEKIVFCLKKEKKNRLYTSYIEEIKTNNGIEYIKHDYRSQCLHGLYVKTSFLKEYNIRFSDSLRYYEDTYFINILMTILGNDGYLDIVSYKWNYIDNSMVRSIKTKYNNLDEKIKSIIDSHNFLRSNDLDNDDSILNDILYLYVVLTSNVYDFPEYKEKKEMHLKIFFNWIKKYKEIISKIVNNDFTNYINQIVNDEKKKYDWFELIEEKNIFFKELFQKL